MHFLATLTGFYGIFDFVIASKIVGLSLERDLRYPFPVFLVLVNAGVAAGVGGDQTILVGFQYRNGSAIHQLQIFLVHISLNAAAASGFSVLQKGLTYNRFISAIADTFPAVHPSSFIGILDHRKLPEAFPDKFLQRGMAQTSAAFLIAGQELLAWRETFLAAIAAATPNDRTFVATIFRWLDTNQPAKTLSGQITLSRFCSGGTSAVRNCATL